MLEIQSPNEPVYPSHIFLVASVTGRGSLEG